AKIARSELGKAQSGHRQDLLAVGDARRALDLDAEQKLAGRIERPRLATGEVFLLIDAPDGRRGRLRAAAAAADPELVHALLVVRKAAGPHELGDGVGALGLAQQDAMGAAAQDLAELPGSEGDVGPVDAVDRRLDDDGGRAMARIGRPAVDQAAHVVLQAGHVEGAVLHADIDVVGPGLGVGAALLVGQHMAGVRAVVVERLIGFQELDGAVDAFGHGLFPPLEWPQHSPIDQPCSKTIPHYSGLTRVRTNSPKWRHEPAPRTQSLHFPTAATMTAMLADRLFFG